VVAINLNLTQPETEETDFMGLVKKYLKISGGIHTSGVKKKQKSKDVIIIPDKDNPGQRFVNDVTGSALDIAGSLKVINLKSLGEGDDASEMETDG
jgi:hypothetical protein